jgi:hypothetical protein
MLLRWYRRCILVSAIDGRVLDNPWDKNGGSFTGPSIDLNYSKIHVAERERGALESLSDQAVRFSGDISDDEAIASLVEPGGWEFYLDQHAHRYLTSLDEIPHHFQLHFLHAAEIVGFKHPDGRIRAWWRGLYERLVHDMHLWPETEEQLDRRLGDRRDQWLERADPATVA